MNEWQAVEGVAGTDILALINKPSITNSNAYLLRTASRLVVFDPGADSTQIERLNLLIADVQAQAPRQVIMILTHAHVDHFRYAERLRAGMERPLTLMHEIGARAIREKDRRHTLAILYRGVEIPDLAVDAVFFGPEPAAGTERGQEPGPDGVSVPVERLQLEPGVALEIYATPGHSSCSCSFRIGRHLIIGDVTFGANPGLAGLIGWSSEGLVQSTRLLRHLIGRYDIGTCWVGHGNPLTGSAADRALAAVASQVAALGRIALVDEDRITLLRRFAVELLQEIERLLTLIGARLMIVAHHLDELEEPAAAARLGAILDFDAVEMQLAEFRDFCRAFERGDQPELSVAMKAAATMSRIRRAMIEYKGGGTVSLSLVGRAEHLIDAFLQTIQGLSLQLNLAHVDLQDLVDATIQAEQQPPFGADEFLAASDDEDAFLRLLVGNLSSGSVLRGRVVTVNRAEGAQEDWDGMAAIDVLRFQNILLSTLEALAAAMAAGPIAIGVTARTGNPVLHIETGLGVSVIPPMRAGLYRRAMQQMGGDYTVERGTVLISLQAATSDSRTEQ